MNSPLAAAGRAARSAAFQPLSDLASLRLGIGCFSLAAAFLFSAGVLDAVATVRHGLPNAALDAVLSALSPVGWLVLIALARGLALFERKAPPVPVVVHPLFGTDFWLATTTVTTASIPLALPWMSPSFDPLELSSGLALSCGMMFASCAWKRRPPSARWRPVQTS